MIPDKLASKALSEEEFVRDTSSRVENSMPNSCRKHHRDDGDSLIGAPKA
ncbi:hypothetical protein NXX23_21075 [Bacteroides ovatus]|nr:hypothetical protein [Bacteroides ovatus]